MIERYSIRMEDFNYYMCIHIMDSGVARTFSRGAKPSIGGGGKNFEIGKFQSKKRVSL